MNCFLLYDKFDVNPVIGENYYTELRTYCKFKNLYNTTKTQVIVTPAMTELLLKEQINAEKSY